jgi:hypothetical protein
MGDLDYAGGGPVHIQISALGRTRQSLTFFLLQSGIAALAYSVRLRL